MTLSTSTTECLPENGVTAALDRVNRALESDQSLPSCDGSHKDYSEPKSTPQKHVRTDFGSTDSGYHSSFPSPDVNSNVKGIPATATGDIEDSKRSSWGLKKKKKALRRIDRVLNKAEQDRFDDLTRLIGPLLKQYLSKKRTSFKALHLTAHYLCDADDEESARPFFIVCCLKSDKIAKHVNKFLAKDGIRAEVKSTNDRKPSFDTWVEERLQLFNNMPPFHVTVRGQRHGSQLDHRLLHGQRIKIHSQGGEVHCTLGGIIAVQDWFGKVSQYGLTVGHGLISRTTRSTKASTDDDSDTSVSDNDDGEDEYFIEGDEEEKEASIFEQDEAEFTQYEVLGSTSFSPCWHCEESFEPNKDWALVQLDQNPTRIELPSISGIPVVRPSLDNDLFFASLANRDEEVGLIRLHQTSTIVGDHTAFGQTYSFFTDAPIGPGDSGVWLTEQYTNLVIGQVIGCGFGNEVIVMPMEDIISDIKESLNAQKVWLSNNYQVAVASNKPSTQYQSTLSAPTSVMEQMSTDLAAYLPFKPWQPSKSELPKNQVDERDPDSGYSSLWTSPQTSPSAEWRGETSSESASRKSIEIPSLRGTRRRLQVRSYSASGKLPTIVHQARTVRPEDPPGEGAD